MRRKTLAILGSGSGFNSSSRALNVVIPHLGKADTVPEQIRARASPDHHQLLLDRLQAALLPRLLVDGGVGATNRCR